VCVCTHTHTYKHTHTHAHAHTHTHSQNLATITVEALLLPQTEGVTFEALDVRKSLNPDYPAWQRILRQLN